METNEIENTLKENYKESLVLPDQKKIKEEDEEKDKENIFKLLLAKDEQIKSGGEKWL